MDFADSTIKYFNIINFNRYNPITCLYNFKNEYLLSGSLHRIIIIWNSVLLNSNKLTVHQGRINSIVYLNDKSYIVHMIRVSFFGKHSLILIK